MGRLIIEQGFIKLGEIESTRLCIKLQKMFSGLILKAKYFFILFYFSQDQLQDH